MYDANFSLYSNNYYKYSKKFTLVNILKRNAKKSKKLA